MEKIVIEPPDIPTNVTVRVVTSQPTLVDLERMRERTARSLEDRRRELNRARAAVMSLERQVENVETSLAQIDERIEGVSAVEKVEFLSKRVEELENEMRELKNPRGRECY